MHGGFKTQTVQHGRIVSPAIALDAPHRQEDRPACAECGSTDFVGPFEMDGVVDGTYRPRFERWTVCRGCGRTAHVERAETGR